MSAGDGACGAEGDTNAAVATLIATRVAIEDLTGVEGKLTRPIRELVDEVLDLCDNKLHRQTLEEMEKDHADFQKHWQEKHPEAVANLDLVPPGLEKARTSDWRPHYQIIIAKVDKDGTIHIEVQLKAEKPFSEFDPGKAYEKASAELERFKSQTAISPEPPEGAVGFKP